MADEPYVAPTTIVFGEDTYRIKSTRRHGGAVFDVEAGKSLKMETSPNGEEKLDITVPAGKSWEISMTIHIVETDI